MEVDVTNGPKRDVTFPPAGFAHTFLRPPPMKSDFKSRKKESLAGTLSPRLKCANSFCYNCSLTKTFVFTVGGSWHTPAAR